MSGNRNIQSKHLHLSIDNSEDTYKVVKALASKIRLQILKKLGTRSMNVNELSEQLAIPISTAAENIRILDEAGLIISEHQPGVRGIMKLCNRRIDSVLLNLVPVEKHRDAVIEMSIPVGCYSLADDILPTCGLAGPTAVIGEDDNPRSFYCPERFGAQLIWFRQGFVTYHFSVLSISNIRIKWLEITFEACSEAPMYRDPWKSDIEVAINDVPIGLWTSPRDCGGRRGFLNPPWWSDMSTQYGMLKSWCVNDTGTYIENTLVSGVTLDMLKLMEKPFIAVRIGVPSEAEHVGGINLFGKGFGDFAQDIVLRVGYSSG